MKLTIDTGVDSKDDLRKVIRFLQLMVNERDFRNVIERRKYSETPTEPTEPVDMGMFFDSVESKSTVTEEPKKDSNAFKMDFF